MRLIDAETIENYEGWLDNTCLVIPKDLIYEAPTIEAEPVRHGHWIDRADKIDAASGRHHYQCNVCARYLDAHVGGTEDWWDCEAPNYCPNCGTKMNEVTR